MATLREDVYKRQLLYFMVETVLLILLLLVADLYSGAGEFLTVSLPVGVTCLLLPWGILLALRYLPVNRWFRAAASTLWTAVWIWFFPVALDWILTPAYGPSSTRYTPVSYTHLGAFLSKASPV